MKKKYFHFFLVCLFSTTSFAQNGLSFDGSNDKVDLGNPTSLQLNGTNLTIEAWIYPTSWRTNVWEGGIVVKEQNIQAGYMFRAGNSGRLNFAFGTGGVGASWNELTTATNVLTLNVWQHVAATYDGSKVRLYRDGLPVDSISYTGSIGINSNSCVIGGWFDTGRNFPGKIDEVRIWNVTRSQAQIAGSMNGEFCGAPAGLQAYYKFNQGTAGGSNTGLTTLSDLSSNANNGTLQNFTLSGATSNWVTGKALSTPTGGSGTTTVHACDSYTTPSGKNTYTANGTYIDTIISPLGCDSILTINLSVAQSSMGSKTANACNSYVSPSGRYVWKTNGTFYDTIPNNVGCDSVITINLTINQIDTNVLVNNKVLTSYQNGASYQWLDCDNNYAPIAGATSQVFRPITNGNYAVEVSSVGCSDTSACYLVEGIGLDENSAPLFGFYPNPATNFIAVVLNENLQKATVEILTITGQSVFKNSYETSHFDVPLQVPVGLYLLQIKTEKGTQTQRILVK